MVQTTYGDVGASDGRWQKTLGFGRPVSLAVSPVATFAEKKSQEVVTKVRSPRLGNLDLPLMKVSFLDVITEKIQAPRGEKCAIPLNVHTH